MSDAGLLCAEGITKRFGGVQALSDVGFAIRSGEIYGLIGPNGAGKTTLFNVLTGIYPHDGGAFIFDGAPLSGLKPTKWPNAALPARFRTSACLRTFRRLKT